MLRTHLFCLVKIIRKLVLHARPQVPQDCMTRCKLNGRHVVRRRRRRRHRRRLSAHAPAIHAASHFDHEKELHGFLFLCMHVVLLFV